MSYLSYCLILWKPSAYCGKHQTWLSRNKVIQQMLVDRQMCRVPPWVPTQGRLPMLLGFWDGSSRRWRRLCLCSTVPKRSQRLWLAWYNALQQLWRIVFNVRVPWKELFILLICATRLLGQSLTAYMADILKTNGFHFGFPTVCRSAFDTQQPNSIQKGVTQIGIAFLHQERREVLRIGFGLSCLRKTP